MTSVETAGITRKSGSYNKKELERTEWRMCFMTQRRDCENVVAKVGIVRK